VGNEVACNNGGNVSWSCGKNKNICVGNEVILGIIFTGKDFFTSKFLTQYKL